MSLWDFVGDVATGFLGGDDDSKDIAKLNAKEAKELKQTPEAPKTVIGESTEDKTSTSTTATTQEQNVEQETKNMFNQAATQAVQNLTNMLTSFAGTDQQFYENIFLPYQESLITANQEMLPLLKNLSTESMSSSIRALQSNDILRNAFTQQAKGAVEGGTDVAQRFLNTLDQIPSTQERVAAARVGVEAEFGKARQAIERELAAKGQTLGVGQARTLSRNLAIERAKAKASATDKAAEAARLEQMNALQAGVSVLGNQAASAGAGALGIQQQDAALNTGLTQVQGAQGGVAAAGTAGSLAGSLAGRVEGTQSAGSTTGATGSTTDLSQQTTGGTKAFINPPNMVPGTDQTNPMYGIMPVGGNVNVTKEQLINNFLDRYQAGEGMNGAVDGTGDVGSQAGTGVSGFNSQALDDFINGQAVGSAIGSFVGGPLGGYVGGWLGGKVDSAITPGDDGEDDSDSEGGGFYGGGDTSGGGYAGGGGYGHSGF